MSNFKLKRIGMIMEPRAGDPNEVDSRITEEAVILRSDRRVDEDLGNVLVLHQFPALLLELVEELLRVAVVDLGRLSERRLADVLRGWQVTGEERERHQPTGERQADEGDQESDQHRR